MRPYVRCQWAVRRTRSESADPVHLGGRTATRAAHRRRGRWREQSRQLVGCGEDGDSKRADHRSAGCRAAPRAGRRRYGLLDMPAPRARTIADIRRELEAAEQRFETLCARWRDIGTTRTIPAEGPHRETLDQIEELLRNQRGTLDHLHQLWIE